MGNYLLGKNNAVCVPITYVIIFIHTSVYYHAVLLSLTPDGLPLWKYFFFVHTGVGWVGGTAGLTGECLLIILTIIVLFALPCVREKGFFEVSGVGSIVFIPTGI